MVTGSGVNLDFLVPGLGLPHQQVRPCRLTQGVVLTVHYEQRQRDGLQIAVDLLQTSANTKRPGHVIVNMSNIELCQIFLVSFKRPMCFHHCIDRRKMKFLYLNAHYHLSSAKVELW